MITDYCEEIRKHAKRQGLSVYRLFIEAGVDYSNWSRWQSGTSPTVRLLEKLFVYRRPKTKPGKRV